MKITDQRRTCTPLLRWNEVSAGDVVQSTITRNVYVRDSSGGAVRLSDGERRTEGFMLGSGDGRFVRLDAELTITKNL